MKKVILKPLHHRNQECIGIYFDNYGTINTLIRKQANAKWSQSNKCWYVPLSKENYNKLFFALKGKAEIEKSELHSYLADKKKNVIKKEIPSSASLQAINKTTIKKPLIKQSPASIHQPVKKSVVLYKNVRIHPVNAHIIPATEQHLKLKAYSPSTIKTYLIELTQLLLLLKNIPADDLTPEHLKRYLVHCYEKLKLSENTLHSRINAMKFYYEQVLRREKFFWEIPRPKKQLQLPRFFSQNDIVALIKATGNIKHKIMLMLAYSAGLRVSEVVAMKTRNMDESRMTILIEQAKGKKDRMVTLSPVLLVMLREYIKEYKPDPKGYLFAGQGEGEPYSTRSMQLVLATAKEKAGILKPGSVHALRHSFATHLLDKGTDVTIIMKLLGHNDIKTTLRYLHVTNRDMLQIISPLDDLKLE
ncbi:MAG: tyrosine-type recombinase/integrase [Bacteroidota bacterium]|nr:tyrosine-type recombinase/integrase [Bacteroidota bacterium]